MEGNTSAPVVWQGWRIRLGCCKHWPQYFGDGVICPCCSFLALSLTVLPRVWRCRALRGVLGHSHRLVPRLSQCCGCRNSAACPFSGPMSMIRPERSGCLCVAVGALMTANNGSFEGGHDPSCLLRRIAVVPRNLQIWSGPRAGGMLDVCL